jgi:hypothetical protein
MFIPGPASAGGYKQIARSEGARQSQEGPQKVATDILHGAGIDVVSRQGGVVEIRANAVAQFHMRFESIAQRDPSGGVEHKRLDLIVVKSHAQPAPQREASS